MHTVILPTRDEPGLEKFLYDLHEIMVDVPGPYEILVVMGDREELNPKTPPLPNQRILKSYGDSLERAILLGFSCAKGDRIVVMDSDGSHPLESVPSLFRKLNEHDMVVGSRFLLDSEFNQSSFRKIVSQFFIRWAHLYGSKLTDPMSGFFGIRKSILDKISFLPFTWKTALEIELKGQLDVAEIPIKFNKRTSGFSKASAKTGLKILWDLVRGWE